MSGSQFSGDGAGRSGKARREAELEKIKAQAEAKAAQYHAVAEEIEAESQRADRPPLQQRPAPPKAKTAARSRGNRAKAAGRATTASAGPAAAAATLPLVTAADGPYAPATAAGFRPLDIENDELPPEDFAGLLHRASSWLASVVVHLLLILLLGFLTLTLDEKSASTLLTASIADPETAELEDLQFETPPESFELEHSQALPVELEDPGVANLGEATSSLDATAVSEIGTLDISDNMGQIGVLFGRQGKGFASTGDGTGGATFFGVKAGGNRFAFVVDGSKSMKSNGWEACKRELLSAVQRLEPHQCFYVILFHNRPQRMFSDENPEPRPLPATPENVARLRQWLAGFWLQSGTRPLEAMKAALELRPDAIYFLTDGRIHDDTEGFLKEKNKRKDAYDDEVRASTVQTIGFYSNAGQEVLQRIAQANGGSFRFVAPPSGVKPARPRGVKPGQPRGGNRPKRPGAKRGK